MDLVAPQHVGSSRTRARTRVSCTGRRFLNHCTTREAQKQLFEGQYKWGGNITGTTVTLSYNFPSTQDASWTESLLLVPDITSPSFLSLFLNRLAQNYGRFSVLFFCFEEGRYVIGPQSWVYLVMWPFNYFFLPPPPPPGPLDVDRETGRLPFGDTKICLKALRHKHSPAL